MPRRQYPESMISETRFAPAEENPSPPFRGEREGPVAQRWEGEVGLDERSGIPHLTPALSAPEGRRGSSCRPSLTPHPPAMAGTRRPIRRARFARPVLSPARHPVGKVGDPLYEIERS